METTVPAVTGEPPRVSAAPLGSLTPSTTTAARLFGVFRSPYAIAGYILVCALLSIAATAMMRDYTGKDIDGEYH